MTEAYPAADSNIEAPYRTQSRTYEDASKNVYALVSGIREYDNDANLCQLLDEARWRGAYVTHSRAVGKRASIGYDMSMDATPPNKEGDHLDDVSGCPVSKKKMTVANGTAMEPMNSSPGMFGSPYRIAENDETKKYDAGHEDPRVEPDGAIPYGLVMLGVKAKFRT